MQGLTSSTKLLMRLATFIGCLVGIVCLLLSIFVFVNKLLNWEHYQVGDASLAIGIFFLGSIQLFFLGILGEYIAHIYMEAKDRPIYIIKQSNLDSHTSDKKGDK